MEKDKKTSVWKAYLVEIRDRWFSSKQRIIKTIGIMFIPFIYGFVCIAALWNPLANVGKAPIAICSLDKKQLVIEDFDTGDTNKPFAIGIPVACSDTKDGTYTTLPISVDSSAENWRDPSMWGSTPHDFIKTEGGSILNYAHTISEYNIEGNVQELALTDAIMEQWKNNSLDYLGLNYNNTSNKFEMHNVGNFPLTEITYHTVNTNDYGFVTDANDLAKWNDSKKTYDVTNSQDIGQITFWKDTTRDLIGFMDASIAKNQNIDPELFVNDLKDHPLNLYVTYEKTFLAARLIDESSHTLSQLVSASIPTALSLIVNNVVENIADNIGTLVDVDTQPYVWNGGYSWTPRGCLVGTSIPSLTFFDHRFVDGGEPSDDNAIRENYSLTFNSGKHYTIQNEEYREALIDYIEKTLPPETYATDLDYLQLNSEITTGVPLIPSIEGDTITSADWGDTSPIDANAHSLLHRLKNITTGITQVTTISGAIADFFNWFINDNLNLLSNSTTSILNIDISATSIFKLFSQSRWLCSLFLQDGRFTIPDSIGDSNTPIVPILYLDGALPFGIYLNFGSVIALLCYYETGFQNIFQTLELRSAYADSNFSSSTGYNQGNILKDLNLPDAIGTYSYAKYNPNILSNDLINPLSFTFNANLFNNFHIVDTLLHNEYSDIDATQYMSFTIIGEEWNQYGMGLGQYFICIGELVGSMSLMILYDKKKRVKRISAPKWYFSKSLLLGSTSIISSSILALALFILGWSQIGTTFAYEWLFMLFCGLIFVSIIQGIWFSFRDRTLALACTIIFIVLNVAAGGGTFMPYMQWPFFHYLSYLLPFTYMIHAQGAIIYGIGTGTHIIANILYIFQMMGYLLIFAVVMHALGIYMSYSRLHEIYYGTANKKKLANVLIKLNLIQYLSSKNKVSWKLLPQQEMEIVKRKVFEMYPLETYHKKYRSSYVEKDAADFDT